MDKVKRIELLNYDGHSVETLKFNPPLILFTDEIQIEDFTTQVDEEKNGLVVNIQFESEDSRFEIYDVDIRTSQLLDYIKYSVEEEEGKLNLNKLEEKIYNAFFEIIQPQGESRFNEEFDNYEE